MSVEKHLLFAVLAFEDELIDLQQLTAACRAWASDKSKPLADLLVERGWITTEHRQFLEDKAERKLAKHQADPRVTLNAATRGDVCDALLKEVDDSDVRQSLSSWPSVAPVLIETLIDTGESKSRYTWVSEVGAGGLGKVWLARDNNLGREVALKEIKLGAESSEAVRRLIKEAQITGQLQHPGIVPIYEVNHEGRPFYTMKLVKGETLSKAIRQHHEAKQAGNEVLLSERRLFSIFLSVCDAMAYAHSRGVIHRDLKPDNIVLGDYGEAIVLDWGLARQIGSDDEDTAPIVVTEEGQTAATRAGTTPGTPAYMAPEQASGRVEHMDGRTDIYGLGAILFEILSGQPPHRVEKGTDPASSSTRVGGPLPQSPIAALLHRIATGETPRVHSIDQTIPDELDAVCATAMAKHRDERYQTAKELKAALLEFQVHEESIELAARADDDLAAARQSGDYDDFSRARFGFETALEHWPENPRAADGLSETRRDYSQAAFGRGDFDLALSLLDAADPNQSGLVTTIQAAAEERSSHAARVRRLRRFGVAASLTIAVLASVASVWINSERNKALAAQQEEATQRGIAEKNEKVAQEQRRVAKDAEGDARLAEADAKREAENARRSLKVAERNAYNSDMLLAQRDWEDTNIGHLLELLDKYGDRDDLKGFEWGFWDRLAHCDLITFKGHTNRVRSVVFSPDGTRLASTSWDQKVKVWDAVTGQETLTLKGHADWIFEVSFSLDGTRLASASNDNTVKVWDAVTGQEKLTLKGHTDGVNSVAFSPDGTRLASASGDSMVKVWNAVTGQEMLTLKGHTDRVNSVAFSPDGTRLASASVDNTVKTWDVAGGQETLTLKGHIDSVTCIAFSPDGTRLASASYDNTVKMWDAATGQETLTLRGHTARVLSVLFNSDGTHLVSASVDKTVRQWDAVTGHETLTLKGHTMLIPSVSLSPDGTQLASASDDKTVKVWDVATGQNSLTFKGNTDQVSCVSFSPDGMRLASASGTVGQPGKVRVWDAASGQETLTLKGHTNNVSCVSFSPDGTRLASASWDDTVKVWDAATGQVTLTLKGHTGGVDSVSFSPDGTRLASASYDKTVKVWDVATGQEMLAIKGHASLVNSVSFSPDGTRLASASHDDTVKVWDAVTGQETLTLKGHTGWVYSVSFSPDGTRLASASWDKTVKIWDAVTGQETLTLKGHSEAVHKVSFSSDGKRLASASGDKTVKVWDVVTGQETLTLKGHAHIVNSVSFSPDGTRLASASWDKTMKIWDARPWTPKLRAESQASGYLTVHRDRATSFEALKEYIGADHTISETVRQQALDWSELFWKNRQPAID